MSHVTSNPKLLEGTPWHTHLSWHPCSQHREAVHTGGDHIHWRVDD